MCRFIAALALYPALLLAGCSESAHRSTYQARHELQVKVPKDAKVVRIWFTLPQDEPSQSVSDLKVEAPIPHRVTTDSEGNKMLYLEAKEPKVETITVLTTFTLARSEVRANLDPAKSRPLSTEEMEAHRHELESSPQVVINPEIQKLSAEVTKGEKNPLIAARAIYDWEIANIDYWVKDPAHKKASPLGSTEYCLATKTGNCSDFHSLWASLARAVNVPSRIIYGSLFKKELDGADEDQSYHCWIEFFAPGLGWVPLDASMADIYRGDFQTTPENALLVRRTTPDGYFGANPEKVSYYFGNLEDRRVTWSKGRDLILEPRQSGSPVNALPKAYVEVDGQPLADKTGYIRKLTFRQVR